MFINQLRFHIIIHELLISKSRAFLIKDNLLTLDKIPVLWGGGPKCSQINSYGIWKMIFNTFPTVKRIQVGDFEDPYLR